MKKDYDEIVNNFKANDKYKEKSVSELEFLKLKKVALMAFSNRITDLSVLIAV